VNSMLRGANLICPTPSQSQLPLPSTRPDPTKIRCIQALGVFPTDVIHRGRHRRLASQRGVGPAAIIELQPVGQGPEALREGAPVPATWPYSAESWEVLAAATRQHAKFKSEYDFAYGIAVRGLYPDELATGQLRPGTEINAFTGEAVRRWPARRQTRPFARPPRPTFPRQQPPGALRNPTRVSGRGNGAYNGSVIH